MAAVKMNQDNPAPVVVANAVVMTDAQLDDLKKHIADVAAATRDPAKTMTDGQFEELRALLAPGAELSKLMLADYKANRPTPNMPTTRGIVQAQEAQAAADAKAEDDAKAAEAEGKRAKAKADDDAKAKSKS